MKKSNFTETQIVKAIQEHEKGRDAKDICREFGITTSAFYKWRQRYGGMEVNELKRVKELEAENSPVVPSVPKALRGTTRNH
jgi:putative transposase